MTSTAISAQGTVFQIATGSGSAKTVSGTVGVGNPTTLVATAHGFSNGDVVVLASFTGADAALLNGQTVVVQFKTANGFAVAIDTTGKTITTGSATATPNTYTSVNNIKDFSGFDGTTAEIDVTNMSSTAKEFVAGLQDNGMFTVNLDTDFSDAGQAALLAAKVAGITKNLKLILPNGKVASFSGFVKKFGGAAAGGVDAVVKAGCDIRITGNVTWA
jgi:hypothetical protein